MKEIEAAYFNQSLEKFTFFVITGTVPKIKYVKSKVVWKCLWNNSRCLGQEKILMLVQSIFDVSIYALIFEDIPSVNN